MRSRKMNTGEKWMAAGILGVAGTIGIMVHQENKEQEKAIQQEVQKALDGYREALANCVKDPTPENAEALETNASAAQRTYLAVADRFGGLKQAWNEELYGLNGVAEQAMAKVEPQSRQTAQSIQNFGWRDEVLEAHLAGDMQEVQRIMEQWMQASQKKNAQ